MYNTSNRFSLSNESVYVSSNCNEDSMVVLNIDSKITSNNHYRVEYILQSEVDTPSNMISEF